MKRHGAPLALGILVLMAGPLQEQTARGKSVSEASHPDQNTTQSEWKPFSPKQGGFSVLLPGTPTEETEVREFPVVGKGEAHVFVLTTEAGVYVASYLEVPGLARQNQSFCDSFGKGFLKTVGESTAKGAGGKVAKETDILFGKNPGKETLIEVPAGTAMARAYFIRRRGYQLIAAPAPGSDPANVKKFLDSFRLTAP